MAVLRADHLEVGMHIDLQQEDQDGKGLSSAPDIFTVKDINTDFRELGSRCVRVVLVSSKTGAELHRFFPSLDSYIMYRRPATDRSKTLKEPTSCAFEVPCTVPSKVPERYSRPQLLLKKLCSLFFFSRQPSA